MRNKILRGLGSTLLVMAMVALLFPVAVFGSNPALQPENGTLTIHKFAMDDMDKTQPPNDGTEIQTLPEGAVPISGVEFTLWKVDTSDGFYPDTPGDVQGHLLPGPISGNTADDGTLRFDLSRGVYLVQETSSRGRPVNADGTLGEERAFIPCEPFLVSVPMVNPTGDGWLTDVHVYPKDQYFYIDKFVNAAKGADYDFENLKVSKSRPVGVGEWFGMTIAASLPDDRRLSVNDSYIVFDEMPEYFDYDPASLRVYNVQDDKTPCQNRQPLEAGKYYTASYDAARRILKIELTHKSPVGRLDADPSDSVYVDDFLVIKYDCKLNDKAPQNEDLFTGARVEYTLGDVPVYTPKNAPLTSLLSANAPTVQATLLANEVTVRPTVHTGQVRLTKLNAQNEQKLAGANFGIANTKEDAQAGRFIATAVSGDDGWAYFKGLTYGNPGDAVNENTCNTTFWVVETKEPDGFIKLAEPFEVQFSFQQCSITGEYLTAQATVYNEPLKAPPSSSVKPGVTPPGTTPQTGDSLLMLAGVATLGLAAALFFFVAMARRKKTETEQ